jgi:hypothetical protein
MLIKGTTTYLCSDVKPVTVTVSQKPSVNSGPDQVLEYQFTTGLTRMIRVLTKKAILSLMILISIY